MMDRLIRKGKLVLVLFLILVLLFNFTACSLLQPGGANNTGNADSVMMEREPESPPTQIADAAAALALRQYIYARMKTEAFVTADFKTMPVEELSAIVDEALAAWDTEALLSAGAEEMADRADSVLTAQDAAADGGLETQYTLLAGGRTLALAASGSGQEADAKAWAEDFTKQFDAIKGNQKIKQLAQQLGQDAKTVHEQLEMAQAIIRNEATADAAFWDKMTKAAMATKTGCKVALFVTATVVTGGGSLSALGASSMTLGQAGAVIVSGTDCILDISATGSTIILGENHQVTMRANELKDKLGPVSAVVGLLTLDTGGVEDTIAYIGDSLTEWFEEGKIMGIKMSPDGKGGTTVKAERIGAQDNKEDEDKALKDAGFEPPQESTVGIDELEEEYEVTAEEAATALDEFSAEMDAVEAGEGNTDTTAEVEEPDGEQEQAATSAEMDVTGNYDVTGTAIYDGEPDDFTPFQATVQLDGTNMVIMFSNSSGTVLQGTYDMATSTFTGIDPNMPEPAGDSMEEQMEAAFSTTYWQLAETTIHFEKSGSTVQGKGGLEIQDENSVLAKSVVFQITMVKAS